MRIGVEANSYYKNSAGTGVYVRNIVDLIKEKYPEHEIVLFANMRERKLDLSRKSKIKRIFGGLYDICWMQIVLPLKLWRDEIDILFCPTCIIPIFTTCPVVATILDMSLYRYPETCDFMFRLYSKLLIPFVKLKCNRIITISSHAKKEIVEIMNIPDHAVVSTYPGYDRGNFAKVENKSELEIFKNRYKIDYEYILSVGTLEPRKNIVALIWAFSILKEKYKIPHKLVLCGGKGWYYESIFDEVRKKRLDNDVVFRGFVPEVDLKYFYNTASVFVYPSLYEGFGLPVLEALACGCPVITSNSSSLPEVSGDAGILIDPNDFEQLAIEIKRVIEDSNLRNVLINKGLIQAKKFSWNTTAEETMKVILDVARRDRNNSNTQIEEKSEKVARCGMW